MSSTLTIYDLEGRVIHTGQFEKMRDCLKDAIDKGKSCANANLKYMDLHGFSYASGTFTGADMTGCNLRNADFKKAAMSNARLDWADVYKIDLRGATTTGMKSFFCDFKEWKGTSHS